MRTIGAGNAAQPTSGFGPNAITAVKIEVANAADVLTDLTAYTVSLEYDQTTDEIVDAAVIVFKNESGASSLAPLMTASPPVALGRRVVVSINPGSGTYKEVFRGQIDDVDWPERFGDVTIKCRDRAGIAADTWVEDKVAYSTTAGVSLETVMQAVVDDNLTTTHTLNFPAATSAVVQHVAGDDPYGPSEQSTLDALRALAESIGWTIRWRHFDASASDWKWTVFQPSRTKTVPDHTFGASDYWEVTQLGQSIVDIRNVVEVEYTTSGGARARVIVQDSESTGGAMTAASATLTVTGGNTFAATDVGKAIKVPGAGAAGATLSTTIATYVSATQVTLSVAASTTVSGKVVEWGSIASYGRRYMKISEASDSPINNSTKATALANAALSDLKDPDALLEIQCRYFWPGEVGVDLYRFTANNKHFSSDQDLAAMSFRHRIAVGEQPTTWITTRGKPSGGVLMWKRRIGNTLPTTVTPDILVYNFRETARTETEVTLGWNLSGSIDELWVWYSTPSQPLASDVFETFTGQPTVRLTGATTSYTLAIPDPGSVTYFQVVPIGVRTNVVVRGEPKRYTLQGEQIKLLQQASVTAQSATQTTVRVRVANPLAGGNITVTAAATGCTIDTTSQTILSGVVTSSLDTTGYVDFVITRPAFQAGTGRVVFTATATDRIADVDAVDVPAQERDTVALLASGVAQSSGATTVVYRVAVADPATGGSGDVSIAWVQTGTGGVAPASPQTIASASVTTSLGTTGYVDFTVTRPAVAAASGIVTFTCSRTGRAAAVLSVSIPAEERDFSVDQIATTEIENLAITAAKLGAAAVEEAKIAAGAVTEAKLGAAAVTTAKLANLAVTDAILAAGAVTTTKITDTAVTSAKIAANTIVAGNIAAGTITTNEIAANTIVAGNIAAGTITATEIAAATITGAKIAALTITAANIAAGTITAAEIAASAITTAKLDALAVTTDKIASNAITAAKIAANTITASQIAAGTITATELAAGSVTAAKISVTSLAAVAAETGNLTITSGSSAITFKLSTTTLATEGAYAISGADSYAGIEWLAYKLGTATTASLKWYYQDHASLGAYGILEIGGRLVIPTAVTPSTAAAAGVAGTIAWDSSYIYVCTAASTWKRVAIATW